MLTHRIYYTLYVCPFTLPWFIVCECVKEKQYSNKTKTNNATRSAIWAVASARLNSTPPKIPWPCSVLGDTQSYCSATLKWTHWRTPPSIGSILRSPATSLQLRSPAVELNLRKATLSVLESKCLSKSFKCNITTVWNLDISWGKAAAFFSFFYFRLTVW